MRIDGKEIAASIFSALRESVVLLKKKNITPHLVVILVGNDPASVAYVNQKKKRGEEIGINVSIHHYKDTVTTAELLKTIKQCNNDSNVHGIIVQQPVPKHIDIQKIITTTDPRKDVDGFHSHSSFVPPIAEAAIEILKKTEQNDTFPSWLKKQEIVVIGKGETGGTPIINKLQTLGATVRVIDSKTTNPEKLTRKATIIISCVGRPDIITKNNITKGVILLSIGMFRGDDGKLHGDYEEEDIKDIAKYYTPVPGGIGPINVAMLLKNTLLAATLTET